MAGKSELSQKLEQREAEIAVVNSVQKGILAKKEMQEIYDLLGEKVRNLFDAQVVGICTFDYDQNTEHFHYLYEDDQLHDIPVRPIDNLRRRLIETGELILINEDADDAWREITGEEPTVAEGTKATKSALYVPMASGENVFGYITLQNLDREHAFSDTDVRLLSTMANSISMALENARLFNETEQRNAELAVINSVQEGLVAEMDMQGIYDLVGDRLQNLFDAQVTGIYTFDLESSTEYFQYLYEDGERLYPEPRPLDKIRKWLIDNKKLLLVNEDADETIFKITGEGKNTVPGTRLPKSLVFVPLIVGDEIRGCVSLQNLDHENAFSDSDVRLLSTLSNSMSVALENARLFNETEQRNAELAVINSVQEGLVAEMDLQSIYDLVGDRIRNLFDAQSVTICTFDHEKSEEHFQYNFENGERFYPEPRPIDNFRKQLIDTKELIIINESFPEKAEEILGFKPEAVPGTRLPKSALFVPLIIGDSVRGYVSLQNVDIEFAFSDSDVRLLSTLANSMSVALENARLFNETEQRNAELAVINSVQQGLVAEMDLQGIYDLVGDRIRDLFDAQVAMISTFDHDSKKEHFQYNYEDGERIHPDPRPLDNFRKRLIETKNVILINENFPERAGEILGIKPVAVPGTELPKSVLFVPLVIGDSVRGYVSLQNLDHEQAFPESDVRLLSTLANSMSVALENARLFNETEQRNAELAVINSVQQGLVAEMDMQGIYDLVGDRIRDLFDAQVVGISTFDSKREMELFQYSFEDGKRMYHDPKPLDKVRKLLISKKKMLIFNENLLTDVAAILEKEPEALPGTEMPKSALFVPMKIGDKVRGYVTLQNLDKERAFSNSDIRLLGTLINSMSVAIENARLFNETTRLLAETEQRNAELAVINSVQDGLVREMDMGAIYKLVGEKICDVLDTQTMIIRTFDHDTGLEYWQYAVENGEEITVDPQPFIFANKILIDNKEHLLINEDFAGWAAKHGEAPATKGLAPKSALFVPMIVGETVVGSVSLQNVEEEHAFTESDLQLITTLTNSMSVAIENARLFNETARLLAETEQRATELQTVNRISQALVSQLEFDALINLVGELMKETFKADIVYVALHNRETDMIHFPFEYGDKSEPRKFGDGFTEKIIKSNKPLLINKDIEEIQDQLQAKQIGKATSSYLGVPISIGDKPTGVISVQSTEQENRFNVNDQRLLTTIAANVGVAMQNAESYEKLRSALNDLKAAQEQLVQQEKLASLGQLTAGIAHEIKNPLNFVNNFSDLSVELLQEIRDELETVRAYRDMPLPGDAMDLAVEILDDVEMNLKKIHEHGTRADGIVKSMLQHSRGGSGKVEPTDMNALIKEYVNLSFHGMRASKNPINVDINLNLDENAKEIPLIAEDFSRVILNLCNNAFDAMREKLQNTDNSSGSSDSYTPELKVSTEHNDRYLNIKIEDNGPGIPPELKDKILQPFFTTKKGKEGTGLGLSITNDIVKGHGGQMDVETEPDSFTRFFVKIPYQSK